MSHVKGWQFLLMVALFFLTQGCASIIKGTTQPIPIAFDPSGADILIDGKVVGQTHCDDVRRA